MKITVTRANDRVTEQSDALDIIAKQLTWLLAESHAKNPPVGSPLSKEFGRRLFQLYGDFLKVRANIVDLCEEMDEAEFDDRTLAMVYKHTAHMLLRKTWQGLFKQFESVAKTGELPPE